jgi:hypothetical protein
MDSDQDRVLRRYTALRRGGRLAPARRIDEELRASSARQAFILISTDSRMLSYVGRTLVDIDRELRRAAVLVRHRGSIDSLPRPITRREGGLEVLDAAPGSFEVVVTGFGVLSYVLLSSPVQTFLTLSALLGKFRTIELWLHQRHDPLARISARDALTVLKAFEGVSEARERLGPPTQMLTSRAKSAATEQAEPGNLVASATAEGDSGYAEIQLPEGGRVVGTRIVYARLRADGSTDVVIAE